MIPARHTPARVARGSSDRSLSWSFLCRRRTAVARRDQFALNPADLSPIDLFFPTQDLFDLWPLQAILPGADNDRCLRIIFKERADCGQAFIRVDEGIELRGAVGAVRRICPRIQI